MKGMEWYHVVGIIMMFIAIVMFLGLMFLWHWIAGTIFLMIIVFIIGAVMLTIDEWYKKWAEIRLLAHFLL